MGLGDRIKELIAEQGIPFNEKARTIYTLCPLCDHSDKFSIIKENGSCICYRGSCEFGRRWFHDWLSLTAKITIKEAKDLIYNPDNIKVNTAEGVQIDFTEGNASQKNYNFDGLTPISFPESHMMKIESPYADEGQAYLNSRGIPVEIAKKYGIHFTPMLRRVVFPISMGGKTYGFQGRHIDKVDDNFKMRNNDGFRRDKLVMFIDKLKNSEYAIICEGPVDAIKFDRVGGNVSTMGKVISEKQLQLILQSGVKRIYNALDEDAANEMNDLLDRVTVPMYKIQIPESCRKRCAAANPPKKADFGECTFEEAEQAFKDAQLVDKNHVFMYFKE